MRDSLIRRVSGRYAGLRLELLDNVGITDTRGPRNGSQVEDMRIRFFPSDGVGELSRKVVRWRGRRRAGASGECPMEVTDNPLLLSCVPNESESGRSCLSMSISHARLPPGKKHERKGNPQHTHLRLRPDCLRWSPTPSRCWALMGA